MSYTKSELVHAALNEIGISDYDYDIGPEQTESALQSLDRMMGSWNGRGIRLGYPLPSSAKNSELEDDSNIPDSAWEATVTNLALRLAPSYGKTVSIDTRIIAKSSLNTLWSISAKPTAMQLNTLPKGAGYKAIQNAFSTGPVDKLTNNEDSELDLQGAF